MYRCRQQRVCMCVCVTWENCREEPCRKLMTQHSLEGDEKWEGVMQPRREVEDD